MGRGVLHYRSDQTTLFIEIENFSHLHLTSASKNEKARRVGRAAYVLINAKRHSKAAADLDHRVMDVMMAMRLKNHQIAVYQPGRPVVRRGGTTRLKRFDRPVEFKQFRARMSCGNRCGNRVRNFSGPLALFGFTDFLRFICQEILNRQEA